jgi:hypothetical protein
VTPDPVIVETDRALEAAAKYLAERNAASAEGVPVEGVAPEGDAGPLRDAQGRFLPQTPAETAPVSLVDNAWLEAARQEGFSDEQIKGFKTDQEVQQQVSAKRYGYLQRLGIDPVEYASYQQWRQAGGGTGSQPSPASVAPAAPPTAASSVFPDLKIEIDEKELAPEVVQPIRAMQDYANKLKATFVAENDKLRQMVTGLYGVVQQSVESANVAAGEAQASLEWDTAAKAIPGFVEVMGVPSEVRKLAWDDPRVQQYAALKAYFEPILHRYEKALGRQNVPLQRVMADAFQASPFALLGQVRKGSNGKTNGTLQPGSVVRAVPRRGSVTETTAGDSFKDEYERSVDAMTAAWNESGVNPFKT